MLHSLSKYPIRLNFPSFSRTTDAFPSSKIQLVCLIAVEKSQDYEYNSPLLLSLMMIMMTAVVAIFLWPLLNQLSFFSSDQKLNKKKRSSLHYCLFVLKYECTEKREKKWNGKFAKEKRDEFLLIVFFFACTLN